MILIFQNAFEGNATDSIAINSKQVVSVYEQDVPTPEDDKTFMRVTTLYTLGNTSFSVKDDFLDVIARLNNV